MEIQHCLLGLCFQESLDRSLVTLCGCLPTQDRCWCCSTEEGALVRSSGNAIALSWEEMIGEMELLLGAGRCYLTAMKRWSAHREALVSQLGAESGREEGEAIQLNWRCRTAFASRVTSWAMIKGAALGKQGHLISFACCQGHVI